MLARTAKDLHWLARHVERAENTARMLDITCRMSLLPYRLLEAGQSWAQPWALPLIITGLVDAYYARHGELTAARVLHFMVADEGHPSSIRACLRAARENARAARDAISADMWEDLNAAWLELAAMDLERRLANGAAGEFFDWVKTRAHQFGGVTSGTMLRDEGYLFFRLGAFLERADNTARILDVKYHTLLPRASDVGGALDYYQWGAVLHSVGAFDAYRRIYHDVITPVRVAELLVLREDVPRSLRACTRALRGILGRLGNGAARPVERLAAAIDEDLARQRIAGIIAAGLHEFLNGFLARLQGLGEAMEQGFFGPAAPRSPGDQVPGPQ